MSWVVFRVSNLDDKIPYHQRRWWCTWFCWSWCFYELYEGDSPSLPTNQGEYTSLFSTHLLQLYAIVTSIESWSTRWYLCFWVLFGWRGWNPKGTLRNPFGKIGEPYGRLEEITTILPLRSLIISMSTSRYFFYFSHLEPSKATCWCATFLEGLEVVDTEICGVSGSMAWRRDVFLLSKKIRWWIRIFYYIYPYQWRWWSNFAHVSFNFLQWAGTTTGSLTLALKEKDSEKYILGCPWYLVTS